MRSFTLNALANTVVIVDAMKTTTIVAKDRQTTSSFLDCHHTAIVAITAPTTMQIQEHDQQIFGSVCWR